MEDIRKGVWFKMYCKFNLAIQLENQTTGEIIRNFKADIYMQALDDYSMEYLKECLISACNDTINIVNDL